MSCENLNGFKTKKKLISIPKKTLFKSLLKVKWIANKHEPILILRENRKKRRKGISEQIVNHSASKFHVLEVLVEL